MMNKRRESLCGTWPAMAGVIGVCAMTIITGSGCRTCVNPFHDPYADSGPVTTASSAGAFEVEKETRSAVREFAVMSVAYADGSVLHGPLYFEDGFGEVFADDGRFAWTGADYLNVLTWRARFLLNAALFPLSVVDTPPWCTMRSDGRPSRAILWSAHDAARQGPPTACCGRAAGGSS